MFIVHRSKSPMYRMVILNRVNLQNLIEDLTADFKLERNGPYLIYANSKDEVNGFWFHDEAALEAMHTALNQCIDRLSSGKATAAKHSSVPPPAPRAIKIIDKQNRQQPQQQNRQQLQQQNRQQPQQQNRQQPQQQQPPLPKPAAVQRTSCQDRMTAAATITSMLGMAPVPATPAPASLERAAPLAPQYQQIVPLPQNMTHPPPPGSNQTQFAAIAVAHALSVLRGGGGAHLSPLQVQAQLLQLSQNPQFVQMVTNAQGMNGSLR